MITFTAVQQMMNAERVKQRDAFAAAALTGLLADPEPICGNTLEDVANHTARLAYLYADAMMAEREKRHG